MSFYGPKEPILICYGNQSSYRPLQNTVIVYNESVFNMIINKLN